jgi:hypothetical protein
MVIKTPTKLVILNISFIIHNIVNILHTQNYQAKLFPISFFTLFQVCILLHHSKKILILMNIETWLRLMECHRIFFHNVKASNNYELVSQVANDGQDNFCGA